MKLSHRAVCVAVLASTAPLLTIPLLGQTSSDSGTAEEDEVVTLSPFEITADSDVGYVATSSLAGSRMNTPLRDTAASISVLTRELLDDMGAVTIQEAMKYATNVQEDAIDTFAAGSSPNDNATFEFFTDFRVRGIKASTTRNYFPWRMPTDSYNIDRIEEQRGPNSILFGIGSAGGILNTSTKQAVHGRNFVKGTLMGGSYNHMRATLDANMSSFDDRLALRFNAVYDDVDGYREHTRRETKRGDLAVSYKIAENTRVRLDYEKGESDEVIARTINVFDAVSVWTAAGSPTIPTDPTNSTGIGRYGSANRGTFIPELGKVFNLRNTYLSAGENNVFSDGTFAVGTIADETLANDTINTGGPSQTRTGEFEAISAFLDHRIGENTFIELAYNKQTNESVANVLAIGSSEGASLRADVNEFLPDGTPNPNVGRYYIEGQFGRFNLQNESENIRLSISSEFDLGKFGDYRIAVMGEHEDRWSYKVQQRESWQGGAYSSLPWSSQNRLYRRGYITPGDWSTYWVPGPVITGLVTGATDQTGKALESRWTNQSAPSDIPEKQDSLLIGGQARYLDGRLVVGFGVRKDKLEFKTYPQITEAVTNDRVADYDNPSEFAYDGVTKTLGVVGHVSKKVSLFANYSTNFSLPNSGIRVLPDSEPADSPEGEGKDFGIAFNLADGKLSSRLSYYETDVINGHDFRFGGSANNPTVFSNAILGALRDSNQISDAELDSETLNSNGATYTRHVEGYEMNVTANLTRDWRLTLSYSRTVGFETDVAPEVLDWYAYMQDYLQPYDTSVLTGRANQTIDEVMTEFQGEIDDSLGLQGLALPGNRKHKASLFTRYNISHGPLKGLFVGGGYRLQSKLVVGLSGDKEIQYGNSFGKADFLAGYNFGDVGFFKNLSVQLNIDNLLNDTDPLITRRRDDGTVYRWKIQEPRTYRATARFSF